MTAVSGNPDALGDAVILIVGLVGPAVGAIWAMRAGRTPEDTARWRYRDRD